MEKSFVILRISEVESTNNYLKNLQKQKQLKNKTVILSAYQRKGRGLGSNYWHSERGKNLLASIYIEYQIPVDSYFTLNISVSLAIIELLKEIGIVAKVKWPNDIYYKKTKIAGILIENTIADNKIIHTIIGVGLNVNQKEFPDELPNPVSISNIMKQVYDIDDLLSRLLAKLVKFFNDPGVNENAELIQHYNNNLYRLNDTAQFEDSKGMFEGKILGISQSGELKVEDRDGQLRTYQHGMIRFIN